MNRPWKLRCLEWGGADHEKGNGGVSYAEESDRDMAAASHHLCYPNHPLETRDPGEDWKPWKP